MTIKIRYLLIVNSFVIVFLKEQVSSYQLSGIVDLPNGQIRGQILTTAKGNSYYAFQGIPYAAPPVRKLRFEPPVEVDNWDGILNTTSDNKICYQLLALKEKLEYSAIEFTEDCLYLSVYIPVMPNDIHRLSLPVMFWIYGGGFSIGTYSSRLYGPEYFMDYGVIMVTHNYRIGAFGFLATEDLVLPGNAGLKDQLFALKWVYKNIRLFGGNPDKITIFGQSAGAASVSYHLNSPLSKGLFRAAILESGTSINPWSYVKNPRENAYKTAAYINSSIDDSNTNTIELVQYLKSLSALELLIASQLVTNEQSPQHVLGIQGYYYAPVIEPEHAGAMVTEKMYTTILTSGSNRVPIIMGFNSEEAILQATNMDTFGPILQAWDEDITLVVPESMNILFDLEKEYLGRFIKSFYCGVKDFVDCVAGGVRYFSDQSLIRGIIQHAILQSVHSDVYFYKFSYDGPLGLSDFVLEGAESVGHSEELTYIWKMIGIDLDYFPSSDILTHDRLLTLWTNFAKHLNPTPQVSSEILQDIVWPTFNHGYLDIGDNLTLEYQPRNETFGFWEFLFETYGVPPFITY